MLKDIAPRNHPSRFWEKSQDFFTTIFTYLIAPRRLSGGSTPMTEKGDTKMSEYEKTKQELKDQEKRASQLIKEIKDITDILINWELSLMDIIANEEQLQDRCQELQDLMKEIIKSRQWLDFLALESQF